ncbi:MAG: metalloregulator ArsR/SmtB family transcription factor, partial [Pseudomonadota bacterium]
MGDLNSTFFALSDETRRAILESLATGEKPLGELARPFDMTQTAVSQHVRLLEKAGLVSIEKRGRVRHCALSDVGNLEAAFGWIKNYEQFWS